MSKNLDYLVKEIRITNIELNRLLDVITSLYLNFKKDGRDVGMSKCNEFIELFIKNNQGNISNDLLKHILEAQLRVLEQNHEKKNGTLLISSGQEHGFKKIQDIFDLPKRQNIIIAGPCAIERMDYLEDIAMMLKNKGISFIRGGAFKPRTSPYDFQGLREDGLKMLNEVGKKYDLYTVTEIVDTRDVERVIKYVDVLQIGARNMHNIELLKAVGQTNHPVILKRSWGATLQEFMFAAEYIGLEGNRKIILCERGIRTFERETRNTLDIASIPIIKKETSLSIIVDLSHSLGRKDIINSIAMAALGAGADGLMIEVHPYPELAFSDSKQQLTPEEFTELIEYIQPEKGLYLPVIKELVNQR